MLPSHGADDHSEKHSWWQNDEFLDKPEKDPVLDIF